MLMRTPDGLDLPIPPQADEQTVSNGQLAAEPDPRHERGMQIPDRLAR